jgi:hypothetical protein
MLFTSEAEAESAYFRYADEAGCSRMNAARFIEAGVPAEYVKDVLAAGATTKNSGITVQGIVDFHRVGVEPWYLSSCLAMGVSLVRIQKLWQQGIAIEYVQVLTGR